MSISRRSFIIGGGTLLAAGGLLSVPLWRASPPELLQPSRFGDGPLSVLAQLQGTDSLAKAFLATHVGSSVAGLEQQLIDRLSIADPQIIGAEDFEARLLAAVKDDFRQQHLCTLTDWILSETECQAATLRHLLFGPSSDDDGAQWSEGLIVEVKSWGPQETQQDLPVNVQGDGHSGLWFQAEDAPDRLQLQIGEDIVPTVVSESVITSGLYGELQDKVLGTPGKYAVVLLDSMRRIRQPLGHFVVLTRPDYTTLEDGSQSTAFCATEDWGPQEAHVGEVPNEQPDGSVGIWIRIGCATAATLILFDGVPLPTTVQPGLLTARLDPDYLAVAREAQLAVHDPGSGETLAVGVMSISDH